EVQHAHDPGVRQRRRHPRLVLEARDLLGLVRARLEQHLHRDPPVQRPLPRDPHRAEAARRERALGLEAFAQRRRELRLHAPGGRSRPPVSDAKVRRTSAIGRFSMKYEMAARPSATVSPIAIPDATYGLAAGARSLESSWIS